MSEPLYIQWVYDERAFPETEDYGTGKVRTRCGRCHELAMRALIEGDVPDGARLVQGLAAFGRVITPIEHSWLELPDGSTWEPITMRFNHVDATYVAAKYSKKETARLLIGTGYYAYYYEGHRRKAGLAA
jgi:hypothetical protein